MATVYHHFKPGQFHLPGASAASRKFVDGTAFGVGSLEFPAGVQRSAFVPFRANNYVSGAVSLMIDWYAATAVAGDVIWQGAIAAITPNADPQDILTKAFATQQEVTQSHLGTTGKRLHRATLAIDQLDALASDDDVWIALRRSAADSIAGAVRLVHLTAAYTI